MQQITERMIHIFKTGDFEVTPMMKKAYKSFAETTY